MLTPEVTAEALRLRAEGLSYREIARRLECPYAAVYQTVTVGPPKRWTDQLGGYGLSGKAHWARALHEQGWSVEAIADRYGMPEDLVVAVLATDRYRKRRGSRALHPDEKRRRAEGRARARDERAAERTRARAAARALVAEWVGDQARPSGRLEASPVAVVGEPETAAVAIVPAELPEPEPWHGPADWRWHGPRKVKPEVVAEALELRAKGWTWPDLAEWFGVSRMGLYYAVRRQPSGPPSADGDLSPG